MVITESDSNHISYYWLVYCENMYHLPDENNQQLQSKIGYIKWIFYKDIFYVSLLNFQVGEKISLSFAWQETLQFFIGILQPTDCHLYFVL